MNDKKPDEFCEVVIDMYSIMNYIRFKNDAQYKNCQMVTNFRIMLWH